MELETHYSLRCLLNAQSGLRSTAAELAKLRRRLDKMLREKGMETARPVHDSIVRGKEKLCSLLNGSRLSLLEIGQEELASASQKLVCSVRHFPIMAPDYTPMLTGVLKFADLLPIKDDSLSAALGHLANLAKIGYYLNPPYLSTIGANGTRTREERRFLIETIPHLAEHGVLIYIIPYYDNTGGSCMTGDRVTFTLSPKSPYVDCSWMDGPQVGRKTIEFSAFVKAIQESTPAPTACSGLLPPGTISYCESSNHQITMTVESSDEYADITYFNTRYEHFPLPHLIFQFSFFEGQRVQSVRIGVAERERLRPDSRMFYYPFSNVCAANGRLCVGSNILPKVSSPHGLNSLPRFLLELPNNDDWFDSTHNKPGCSMRQLLEHLKDKTPDYYESDILIPDGRTLADFIDPQHR